MLLYVEQDEYISHLAGHAGVQVTVHGQNTVPLSAHNGITASPGESTRIGLRRVR